MLVDLTPIANPDPLHQALAEIIGGSTKIERLQTGIYRFYHWNPERSFEEKLTGLSQDFIGLSAEEYKLPKEEQDVLFRTRMHEFYRGRDKRVKAMRRLYSQKYKRNWTHFEGDAPEYGVVDNPAQVLERFPHIVDDEKPRAITCVEIRREDQSPNGGWRYHKWGPYLGRQRPKAEYLYDDKHIEAVWTFHIYGVEKR